ncbi:hypothetical protein KIN20_018188 [Parelaphostrongylus tenuis]|uniref:Uncharacterized protein n=1 Tax=Parelaphostrongylus tenuis TaxID=148309 RepID=A0AAD5MIX9_PARTN|nr:hypothetical protein KIN20_018188 [Parelaphostrongylus tenuis]
MGGGDTKYKVKIRQDKSHAYEKRVENKSEPEKSLNPNKLHVNEHANIVTSIGDQMNEKRELREDHLCSHRQHKSTVISLEEQKAYARIKFVLPLHVRRHSVLNSLLRKMTKRLGNRYSAAHEFVSVVVEIVREMNDVCQEDIAGTMPIVREEVSMMRYLLRSSGDLDKNQPIYPPLANFEQSIGKIIGKLMKTSTAAG